MRNLIAAWAALWLMGCGGDAGVEDGAVGGTDAGAPSEDGGGGTVDAGPGAADAGAARDGAPAVDAETAADAGSGASCPSPTLAEGESTNTLDFDGRTRTYHVYVPARLDPASPTPLVFDFHGYTSNAGQQMALSGMRDKADAEGFLVVHGEGIGGWQSWNGGLCCGEAMEQDADDVGLVRAIVEEVAAGRCVDRRRIYATGMSNGGFLSHRLGCEAADVFAAIAPVAGVIGIPQDECTPARPMPVMHFHGTRDTLVPYDGGGGAGFPSVRETIDGWAARNGCRDLPEITYRMGDSECETLDDCDGGAEVVLCTIERGGHWWPGGPGSGADIVATDAMWDFFVAHPMP